MNTPSQDFEQALAQLVEMYRSLALIRDQVLPTGAHNFGLLAEGTLEHLRRLESTVMELGGRLAAEEAEAPVWLRIQGPEVSWPEAPSSILATFLANFRKGVQAATEWSLNKGLSTRPTKAIKQACDLRVMSLQPGSVQVGIRLPDPPRGTERDPELEQAAESSLRHYLTVASWAGSGADLSQLDEGVPDPELRRLLLTEVKRFIPRPRGDVDVVELSGRLLQGRRTRLTREAHTRIDKAIDTSRRVVPERYVGELREIDLDRLTFRLRHLEGTGEGSAPFEIPCEFPEELRASAVEALDRRVEIAGERPASVGRASRSVPLRVARLVILDDEDIVR